MSAFYFYPITVFPVSLFAERWYSLCFVAKRYILPQKCLKKWIGSAFLGTRRYNFQSPTPLYRPRAPQCRALQTDRQTDAQTDRRQYRVKSRSFFVQCDRLKTQH